MALDVPRGHWIHRLKMTRHGGPSRLLFCAFTGVADSAGPVGKQLAPMTAWRTTCPLVAHTLHKWPSPIFVAVIHYLGSSAIHRA